MAGAEPRVRGLEGPGRGLGRPSCPGSFSLRRWRWPRWNPTGAGPAPALAEAEAAARPGSWAPRAARVMRTEAEAAGSLLEPGQSLPQGPALNPGNERDSALARAGSGRATLGRLPPQSSRKALGETWPGVHSYLGHALPTPAT